MYIYKGSISVFEVRISASLCKTVQSESFEASGTLWVFYEILNRGSGGCFVTAHFPIVNYKASEAASAWSQWHVIKTAAYLCFSNILERAE